MKKTFSCSPTSSLKVGGARNVTLQILQIMLNTTDWGCVLQEFGDMIFIPIHVLQYDPKAIPKQNFS